MNRVIPLFGVLLLAGGCSQLRVEVSIFDMKDFKNNEAYVEAVVVSEDARVEKLLNGKLDATQRKLLEKLDASVDSLPADITNLMTVQMPAKLKVSLKSSVEKSFQKIRDEYVCGVISAREAANVNRGPLNRDMNKRHALFADAKAHFDAGDELRLRLPNDVNEFFVGFLNAAAPATQPAAENSKQVVSNKVKKDVVDSQAETMSIIGNNGIIDDPFASVITSAPEGYWRGSFNRVYGIGTLGDTDVAVRMDDVANFTLKGVRNDASKVTPAVFQGLSQAVKVAGAIYGVPMPGGASAGGGSTSTSSAASAADTEISTANTNKQSADLKVLKSRAAALNLLGAIVAERSNFPVPGAAPAPDTDAAKKARAASLANVKSALDATKADLSMN
jgi:hypothetical protein